MHVCVSVADGNAGTGCMQESGVLLKRSTPFENKTCREGVDGRVSWTYLPEPVRRWRRRQQQSWYAAGPLLDRNATVGRGYTDI